MRATHMRDTLNQCLTNVEAVSEVHNFLLFFFIKTHELFWGMLHILQYLKERRYPFMFN